MTATLTQSEKWKAQRKQRALDELRGLPRGLVDRAVVVQHLATLRDLGFSQAAIMTAAGRQARSLQYAVELERPTTYLAHARRYLALTAQDVFARSAGDCLVPSYAAIRRYQALQWMGWRQADIDAAAVAATGVHAWPNMLIPGERISAARHRAMAGAYDALSHQRGPSVRTASLAVKAGHAPPIAWDDIDDPDATPDMGERAIGADLDEFVWLMRTGETLERAVQRLGVSVNAIERQAMRKDRRDVLDRLSQARTAA